MVLHNGFDGSSEEMHFVGGVAGVERGYHVLTFDGPGQPSAIHGKQLLLRPDWENVVGPVLDYLATRPEIDQDRIGLLGLSLGGMLAPRAAAFDRRIATVVAAYMKFNLFDGVAEKISCPILVCAAENDLFFAGDGETRSEPDRLYDHLTGPKTLLRFTGEEGADAHCHVGAQRLAMSRIYDWLDDTLRG
jgi:dienelactone hydrolase